jgi:hypothetical protein
MAASVALYLLDPFLRITSRDFLPSDVLFILSFLLLLSSELGPGRFTQELSENPGILAFWLFILAAFIGFLFTAMQRPVVQSFHFFSAMQLVFVFVLLYPLVQVHKNDISKAQKLWSVHLWLIPFAGLLSVADMLGITNVGQDFGERHYSGILDTTFVNGFWLFGLISPFLLQKLFPSRLSSALYAALWLLGCFGTIIAGSRGPLVIVLLSVAFIGWLNRRELFRDARMFAGLVLFVGVLVGAGVLLGNFPVIFNRISEAQDFVQTGKEDNSLAARSDQYSIVLNEWAHEPLGLLGRGFKQYRVIHPDDPAESIHNIYVQQLYDAGPVGLVAFLTIFAMYFRWCGRFYSRARKQRDIASANYWACCCFVIVAYLLFGFIYPVGYYRNFWLPLFLAVPSYAEYRTLRLEEDREKRAPRPEPRELLDAGATP